MLQKTIDIMNKEAQEIALRYKGEDYKQSVERLQREGFINQGFNEWCSPVTGCIYRMMIAHDGGYISRVECVGEDGPQLINTEFYDHQQAMEEYDEQCRIENGMPLGETLHKLKVRLLKTSLSKVLRTLESEKEAGNPYAVALYETIVAGEDRKLGIRDYLFVGGDICLYSPSRRPTHELKTILENNGKKLYLYKARHFTEDLLDSLASKVELGIILGKEAVEGMNEKAE